MLCEGCGRPPKCEEVLVFRKMSDSLSLRQLRDADNEDGLTEKISLCLGGELKCEPVVSSGVESEWTLRAGNHQTYRLHCRRDVIKILLHK